MTATKGESHLVKRHGEGEREGLGSRPSGTTKMMTEKDREEGETLCGQRETRVEKEYTLSVLH